MDFITVIYNSFKYFIALLSQKQGFYEQIEIWYFGKTT